MYDGNQSDEWVYNFVHSPTKESKICLDYMHDINDVDDIIDDDRDFNGDSDDN